MSNIVSLPNAGVVPQVDNQAVIDGVIEALVIYCSILGKSVSGAQLTHGINLDDADLTPQMTRDMLRRVGFVAQAQLAPRISAELWPACVLMQDGSYAVVLSQDEDTLFYANPQSASGYDEITVREFSKLCTEHVLVAEPTIEELKTRHVGQNEQSHWFWGELLKHKRILSEVVMGSFVASLLAVAISLFALQVYDRVIPHQSQATLWVLVSGVGIAIVLESFLRIARTRLMDGAGRAVEVELSSMLFSRVLGMRMDKRPTNPSSLIYAMREFGSVREFFTATSVGSVADIPFVAVFLFIIYTIAGNVVWIIVAAGVIMVLPSFLYQRKMARLSREMMGGSSSASRILNEAIFGQENVKSVRGESRLQQAWDEIALLNAVKTTEQRSVSAGLTYWATSVQQAAYVGTVVMGCYYVFAGVFTVGTIIAVGLLTSRTLAPLTQLSSSLVRWNNVSVALEALGGIVDSEQDRPADRSLIRRKQMFGDFELKAVQYGYDEDSPASVNIGKLDIKRGESIAILGTNGSGKSTLLKLLAGLYHPHHGTILLDGLDYRQVDPSDLRANIGYLPQEVRLFTGTLRDNLRTGPFLSEDARLLEALDFGGLGDFVRKHPKGLDLEILDGGDGLSTGQRQSLGWARLYLQNPKIVLLDEPTSAMDQSLEVALVNKLQMWLRGRTAIIATHRVPILQLTQRTLIIQDGQLAIDGPRDEVIARLQQAQNGTLS